MTVLHKDLTGAELHEPKGVSTAASGEVYVADGAGSGSWENPLADISNLNSYDLNGVIEDVSTANSSYSFRVGRNSTLTNIFAVMSGAITGADSTVSLYRDGILLGQTLPVPVAGSGDGVKLDLNLAPTYVFTAGQVLKVTSNGNSTDPARLFVTAVFTV